MAKTRITLIGLGESGRSIAAGLRVVLRDAEFIGHDKDMAVAKRAETDKLTDKSVINLFKAIEGASIVVMAIPTAELIKTLTLINKDAPSGAIFADVTGSKRAALKAAGALPADITYISCTLVHDPNTAGRSPRPLKGASWLLTPRHGADPNTVNEFSNIVSAMNARPVFLDADEHDGLSLAARTLPAAAASALFEAVSGDVAWRERRWVAGDALRDATNSLTPSSAASLAAALLADKSSSTHWLNQMMLSLMKMRDAIETGDEKMLTAQLNQTEDRRTLWLRNWAEGRDASEHTQERVNTPSISGLLIGDRLADLLRGRRK